MICPNCGNEIREGSKFCTECGVPLPAAPAPAAPEELADEATSFYSPEEDEGLDTVRPIESGPLPEAQPAPPAQTWTPPAAAAQKKRRGLYPFEIAALVISLLWVALLAAAALGVDGFLGDLSHSLGYIILFSTALPALLSLIPPSEDVRGKGAPALAWVSFALVLLFTFIVEMLVYASRSESGMDAATKGCIVVAGFCMLVLLVQSIRRLRRA